MDRSSLNPASLGVLVLLACGALQPDIGPLAPSGANTDAPPAPAVHGPNAVEWVEASLRPPYNFGKSLALTRDLNCRHWARLAWS